MCRDWLTGGGVPRVFGRALGQENSFSHQAINLRRTLTNPTDRGDFGAWFLLISAAFVLNYLRYAFLFRGSFSNPDPGISSARLSTISPTTRTFFGFFPPYEKKKKGRTPNEAKRKSDCLLRGWDYAGRKAPARRSGEGLSIPSPRGAAVPRGRSRRARGKGGERQLTCRETSLRTGFFSGGRGKRGDASSSCGSGERCGEPGAAGSRRQTLPPPARPPTPAVSHPSSPSPSLTRKPISPGSYECACLYFSLRRATTTYTPFWLGVLGFVGVSFLFGVFFFF